MTNEEAKHIVDVAFDVPQAVRRAGEDRTYHEDEIREAKNMAIKALSQEPICPSHGIDCEDCPAYKPCEDAISRAEALKAINEMDIPEDMSVFEIKSHIGVKISILPIVQPQPKTGHWIQTNEFFINQDGQFIYKFICSECKSLSYFRKSNKKAIGANVCPNCGARMESEEQDADND